MAREWNPPPTERTRHRESAAQRRGASRRPHVHRISCASVATTVKSRQSIPPCLARRVCCEDGDRRSTERVCRTAHAPFAASVERRLGAPAFGVASPRRSGHPSYLGTRQGDHQLPRAQRHPARARPADDAVGAPHLPYASCPGSPATPKQADGSSPRVGHIPPPPARNNGRELRPSVGRRPSLGPPQLPGNPSRMGAPAAQNHPARTHLASDTVAAPHFPPRTPRVTGSRRAALPGGLAPKSRVVGCTPRWGANTTPTTPAERIPQHPADGLAGAPSPPNIP